MLRPYTRRRFLENSILAAAAAAFTTPAVAREEEQSKVSANNRLRAAVLGCGIRGKQICQELGKLKDCEIAYVCDPDQERAEELAAMVEKAQGSAPHAVQDLRRTLDDASVDVVFVATPNHWHSLAAIWAMQAGKDVYVEKPVSHNVWEGRRLVEVAQETKRICQGGTQNRSNGALAAAVDYMKQGKLGEVKRARSIVYGGRGSIGGPGSYEVPASVDYNLFAGPAPMAPLTRPKFHYDWHWFWETGNGELGNNNIHSLDICRWGLGLNGLGHSVLSYGGRMGYTDAAETPNTQVCIFDYGEKTIISETRGLKSAPYRPEFKGGWLFEGSEGFIAGTSLFDPEGNLIQTFEGRNVSHFRNFLDAARSRKQEDLNAPILEGHRSTALCHIGNISWRLGRQAAAAEIRAELESCKMSEPALETFDRTVHHLTENKVDLDATPLTCGAVLQIAPGAEAFVENAAADALLKRAYRAPFVVPSS